MRHTWDSSVTARQRIAPRLTETWMNHCFKYRPAETSGEEIYSGWFMAYNYRDRAGQIISSKEKRRSTAAVYTDKRWGIIEYVFWQLRTVTLLQRLSYFNISNVSCTYPTCNLDTYCIIKTLWKILKLFRQSFCILAYSSFLVLYILAGKWVSAGCLATVPSQKKK